MRKRQRCDSDDESESVREKLGDVEMKLLDKEHEMEQLQKQVCRHEIWAKNSLRRVTILDLSLLGPYSKTLN